VVPEVATVASRGPKIVCNQCGADVRLYSLVENDGLVIGCGCEDVRHSKDAMAYEMRVQDLNDDWYPARIADGGREGSQAGDADE